MIDLSGTRTSSRRCRPSGFTNACTVDVVRDVVRATAARPASTRAPRRTATAESGRRPTYRAARGHTYALVRRVPRQRPCTRTAAPACLRRFRSCRRCPSNRSRCCGRRRTARAGGRRRQTPSAPAASARSMTWTFSFTPSARRCTSAAGPSRTRCPRPSRRLGVLLEERFLHELAVGREDLESVVRRGRRRRQLSVDRQVRAVHRVAELLRGRRGRDRRAGGACRRACCRRRPRPLELARVGVDDGDALVQIAVGDVGLVGSAGRRRSWRRGRS